MPDVAAPFDNRQDAGRRLARRLVDRHLPGRAQRLLVLALPRGGVPVGAEVARALNAPLELLLVRKIGAPHQPELAVGAVVDGAPAPSIFDEALCRATGADDAYLAEQVSLAVAENQRRRHVYLHDRAATSVRGATVIVVDDGIATGTTVRAALQALARAGAGRRVLAVPVAPASALRALRDEADELVCLQQPEPFLAVGAHYRDFHQVDDEEVLALLAGFAPDRLAQDQLPPPAAA